MKDFNRLSDKFVDVLKPLADGKTVIPMANHIRNFVLDAFSQVRTIPHD